MSSFGAAAIKVYPEQGAWPLPATDADGVRRYRADVRCESSAAYAALAGQLTLPRQIRRGVGSFAVAVDVDAGPGAAALTVPIAHGTYGTCSAVLTSITPRADGHQDGTYRVSCEWVILTEFG